MNLEVLDSNTTYFDCTFRHYSPFPRRMRCGSQFKGFNLKQNILCDLYAPSIWIWNLLMGVNALGEFWQRVTSMVRALQYISEAFMHVYSRWPNTQEYQGYNRQISSRTVLKILDIHYLAWDFCKLSNWANFFVHLFNLVFERHGVSISADLLYCKLGL